MNLHIHLSANSIKQFKACRRAYELRKIYGVKPVETESDALKTGLAYHSYIERLYTDGILPDVVDKESAMANAYKHYIYPQMPKYEPEVSFNRPLSKTNSVEGRLDGIVKGSELAIVEHKTTSLSTDEYLYNLQWDEQTKLYCLITGARMVYYTICRKPTIRQKTNETEEEFGQRCFAWYADETDEKIKMVKITYTDDEIKQYKKELMRMFSVIRTTYRSGDFYRNTCNCNAWGRKCEYAPICLQYDPSQDYVGFTRSETYADNQCKG